MKNEHEIMARDTASYLPVFSRYPIVLNHGEGSYVWDVNGRKYLDALGGIAVNVLGHNYAPLVDAIAEQAKRLIHVSNLYYTEPQADAAAKLSALTADGKVFFGNSGAEANEGAIKAARKYGHTIHPEKSQIITALGSFHGRTLATLTATGQEKFHKGFEPLPQGFDYVPFNDIAALEARMSENTAAVMLEPIQGEAGVVVPDDGYLKACYDICKRHNVLFIADEIQSGIGRSGRLLACDWEGVKPDILVLGKALSGGVTPVSAVFANDEIMLTIKPGEHGSTYGGNPLACAVGMAALDVVRDEKLAENADRMGKIFRSEVAKINHKMIKKVRGKGLLNAVVTEPSGDVKAWDICVMLKEKGLLAKPTHEHIIRFTPPLIINEAQMSEAVAIIKSVFESI